MNGNKLTLKGFLEKQYYATYVVKTLLYRMEENFPDDITLRNALEDVQCDLEDELEKLDKLKQKIEQMEHARLQLMCLKEMMQCAIESS